MKGIFVVASLFFLFISAASIADLRHDMLDHLSYTHMLIEIFTLIIALSGSAFFIFRTLRLFQQNSKLKVELAAEFSQRKSFQEKAMLYSNGLYKAIEDEFNKWDLTPVEREIGILILKGLSIKEMSLAQGSSDKTIQHHCTSIYKKSGLKGRTELSAYFLEDLLSPSHSNTL